METRRLKADISACRICADRFRKTATAHAPRPVVWFNDTARILIAGQAPGLRVHEAGKPFFDRSGDRLRDWMGIGEDIFYDRDRVAIVPMAFCFPGYDDKGSDLPPPRICASTWRSQIMEQLSGIRLTLLIGGYAQGWHLPGAGKNVTQTVAAWRKSLPDTLPLPHPSWRNTGWLRKNPWFETELLPVLRTRVQEALQ
ncbi:uracil-DNA glycosylase family protein [Silicimonas sp. MF1-12-2]|uniref:uracil-DNA glycosylase family protein n=1 Tax=Silicimonas sp. MF1-12-2 TaxID=3384793 RepID=UPI0039B43123